MRCSSASTITTARRRTSPAGNITTHSLVDPSTGRIDTLPHWRSTMVDAGLEVSVVGLVGDSAVVSSRWTTPLAFCFIDGGHGEEPAWTDYRGWAPKVAEDGWLAIHDVFPDPADGGRPPHDIWRAALDSGDFVEDGECGSLADPASSVTPPAVEAGALGQTVPGGPGAPRAGSTGASGAGSVRSRWLGRPSPRKIPEAGVVRLSASAASTMAPAV